jgi:hypothetical protein
MYPNIKFIISGDFNQLEPVCDRNYFNYEHSRALYELVDGNKLILKYCRRSDDKLFKLCNKILNNKKYSIDKLISHSTKSFKNLCYTNKTRKEINEECMERFLDENPSSYILYNKTIFVPELIYDKNTQNYTLCKGMPLISRVNQKSLKIVNNEMFECKEINDKDVTIINN